MKKGCGESIIKGHIKLSIKCGDWNLDERDFIYCDKCRKKQKSDFAEQNKEVANSGDEE